MGISLAAEFCYFPPSRTGSHSVDAVLQARLGMDYTPFGQSGLLAATGKLDPNSYIDLNGDHTRATMVHRILPETRKFRSVATFRNPLSRVASLYSYTCDVLGSPSSMASFDEWVRLVFCNRYNGIWLAHGLQTNVIFNDLGLLCVDRVYSTDRLSDLLDYLIPGSGADVSRTNQSMATYRVADLRPTTQRTLLDFIAPDLEFWEFLSSSNGVILKPQGT